MNNTSSNPFLQTYNTPFQVPPFQQIENDHFLPAIEVALSEAREEIKTITENADSPSFENTIEALEFSGARLDKITSVLFNLNSAETSEELQKVAQEASPKLTAFNNEIKQNAILFSRIKAVYLEKEHLGLDREQEMLLAKTYKSFVRSGADLSAEDKKKFGEVAIALSKKGLEFGENVLAATNAYSLHVERKEELTGIPEDVLERAKSEAGSRDLDGWVFTLHAPSYIPFMQYADNRSLREQMYRAYMSKSLEGDNGNQVLVKEIVSLREELARLLGFETYAEYVLEERMAEKPEKVSAFLENFLDKALEPARAEVEEIKAFMAELGAEHDLQRWDWMYYSEKLKKRKFNLDDEIVRPYFKLENVIDGVFETASRLFDLSFEKKEDIPTYHEEVSAYEVKENGRLKAIFLADFFPRKGKRPGAWMTSYRDEYYKANGEREIPIISIVCNFTPSSDNAPSLLTFDEVKTLFHEFGHALHGILADTKYKSLSGTSVYWDFVELPSQILENWCYEKECLSLFARHHQSGVEIPGVLIDQLKASSTFHEAYATVRQISFGMLDMAFHHRNSEKAGSLEDVVAVEQAAMASTDLFPKVEGTCMSVQFGHIFAGGYAAGYYSYKWAEVLDADAFSVFKENGVFDKKTSQSFKDHVLSRGGVEHPMDLYKRFRGQEPTPDALLIRAGLKKSS